MNPQLRQQLIDLRALASRTTVPSGVLDWWSLARIPNGRKTAPTLTTSQWQLQYARLAACALVPGWLPAPAALLASQRDISPAGPITLAITCVPYRRTRSKVAAAFTKAVKRDRPVPDPPRSLGTATKRDTAFMIAPLLAPQWGRAEPAVASRVFQLVIDRSACITGPEGSAPEQMRLRVDGNARPVTFGQRVTVVAQGDQVDIELSAKLGKRRRLARCRIAIDPTVPSMAPDEVWPISVPGGVSGRVSVFRGVNASPERRMVILSEGFPGGHSPWFSYGVFNQHGFADRLRNAGRDLLILGMDDGMARIEANAELVIEAIRRASRLGRDHVVGGVSMGGMTTRFALTAMEFRGQPHHTQAYLSIDSPHRGSATCPAVQWLAQTFADQLPLMDEFVAELNSPANQQFLPRWYHDGELMQSPLRSELIAALTQMGGYPQLCRRYAVASGRGDGASDLRPGSSLLTWDAGVFAGARLNALDADKPTTSASGYWGLSDSALPALQTHTRYAWDGAAGSVSAYLGIAAASINATGLGEVSLATPTSCVVPTASALDMDLPPTAAIEPAHEDQSPYTAYRTADRNLPHMAFDAATSDWMLERILSDPSTDN